MSNNPKTAKVLIETAKCYKVILSTKHEVKCDQSEVWRVLEGIKEGGIIKLRQGVINPSFFVALLDDEERRIKFVEQVNDIQRQNSQDSEYHGGKSQRALPSGMKPLKDIFAGTNLKAIPSGGGDVKRLSKGI